MLDQILKRLRRVKNKQQAYDNAKTISRSLYNTSSPAIALLYTFGFDPWQLTTKDRRAFRYWLAEQGVQLAVGDRQVVDKRTKAKQSRARHVTEANISIQERKVRAQKIQRGRWVDKPAEEIALGLARQRTALLATLAAESESTRLAKIRFAAKQVAEAKAAMSTGQKAQMIEKMRATCEGRGTRQTRLFKVGKPYTAIDGTDILVDSYWEGKTYDLLTKFGIRFDFNVMSGNHFHIAAWNWNWEPDFIIKWRRILLEVKGWPQAAQKWRERQKAIATEPNLKGWRVATVWSPPNLNLVTNINDWFAKLDWLR